MLLFYIILIIYDQKNKTIKTIWDNIMKISSQRAEPYLQYSKYQLEVRQDEDYSKTLYSEYLNITQIQKKKMSLQSNEMLEMKDIDLFECLE